MISRTATTVCLGTLFALITITDALAAKKALTFEDLMKFRQIESVSLSKDGQFIAYSLQPDRGDPVGMVKTQRGKELLTVQRGTEPVFSPNGSWVGFKTEPAFIDKLAAKDKDEKSALKPGLGVFDTQGNNVLTAERVKSFTFSGDGQWLAYHFEKPEEESNADDTEADNTEEQGENEQASKEEKKRSKKAVEPGTVLMLRRLSDGEERKFEAVHEYAFDNRGQWLAIATTVEDSPEQNQLLLVNLQQLDIKDINLLADDVSYATSLHWTPRHAPDGVNTLAFITTMLNEKEEPTDGDLYSWDQTNQARLMTTADQAPEGFRLPVKDNELKWSNSGKQLFFGFAEQDKEDAKPNNNDEKDVETQNAEISDEKAQEADVFDVDAILDDKTLVRWHWDDDRIATQRKAEEKDEAKRRYLAVVNLYDTPELRVLANKTIREVSPSDSELAALGYADTPYLKRMTWDWFIDDLYYVNLQNGNKTRIAEELYHANTAALSPNGQFVVWFDQGHWHIWDAETEEKRNLTLDINVSFANEDHDYPLPVSGYGRAQWLADNQAVLIADKFDLWRFPIDGSEPIRLTANGREHGVQYRYVDLDPNRDAITNGNIFIHGYSTRDKFEGFFAVNTEVDRAQNAKTEVLEITGEHRFRFVAKAEDTNAILFTRENYNEFPDLWSAKIELEGIKLNRTALKRQRKITQANPQIKDFAWGNAELVRYRDADGELTDGVLIKPGNYEAGKKYPVIVYFYRFFSQRLFQFNAPVINHRPSFPLYASNGYAIFLPDVRFEIGRPGYSTTKSLVPGVKKLIDMGIADPDAIGLHGHSWSGYSSAFVVTQTDIFSALVTGAPVSNMTSAYSGIRYGSGLARQFQYEQSQSRIGGSLWEYPERYIENSPVFFADRINTPMLIQFGDEDEAVPWTQGIELYLAMRRLEKPAVFLQYEGEPHHLKQYPNKLDYSIKMKAFFDHFLKGEEAPKWWTEATKY